MASAMEKLIKEKDIMRILLEYPGQKSIRCEKYDLLYHAMLQTIIIYDMDKWVVPTPMSVTLDGTYMDFTRGLIITKPSR